MHFWISGINLFQNFNHSILSKLEVKVIEIRKNPVNFIFYRMFSNKRIKKNQQEPCCFCCLFYRPDLILISRIQESRKKISNSMPEEAAAEEVNHVRVTIEEAPLNIDSYLVRSYGSFSQKENL